MIDIIRGMVIGALTLVVPYLVAMLLLGEDSPNSWFQPRSLLFFVVCWWTPYAAVVGGAVAGIEGTRWTAIAAGLSIAFLCSAVLGLLCNFVEWHGLKGWCAYTLCYLYWQAPVAVLVAWVVQFTMHER